MTERELFTEALRRSTAAERAAFLDGACGGDPALKERVEALLARHASDHPLLDRRPGDLLDDLADHARPAAPADALSQLAPILGPSTRPGAIGRLGHYDVLAVLGQGGYGIVVRAFDDTLQRVVAIKVLTPALAATSPPRKRFLREARMSAAVRHENVVQVHAVEEQPLPYLVMEYVDGPTLQQRIDADGPLDPSEVARIGRQIALGLAAAHEKGLIHRDVKPANILLDGGPEPRARLTDFGLARAADDASMTASGVVAGTPMYMAPEQVAGGALDARADLFSLGSVLYTMAAGRPPFRAGNAFAVLKRVAEDTPRPLREVIGHVPPGLAAVISKLHAKKPEDRFADARAAADALGRCLTDGVPVARPRTGRRVAAAVALLLLVGAGIWAAVEAGRRLRSVRPPIVHNPSPPPAAPGVVGDLIVTSTLDDGGPGTLRWAFEQANHLPGENTITFDPTVFAGPTTITLTNGSLKLTDSAWTTVIGPPAGLTVSGDDRSTVIVVVPADGSPPPRAVLADLTIARGRGDAATTFGGGLMVQRGATVRVTGCTFRDNASPDHNTGGGGIFSDDSTLVLTNCTFYRNAGFEGAGIKNFAGTATVTNCTFVANTAGNGAAIWTGGFNRAKTTVNNCIFADTGGREVVYIDAQEPAGDYNLSSDDSAPGAHTKPGTPARLGQIGRHGGPTETCVPLPGSPVIDAGGNDLVPADIRTDQRGAPRVVNGAVDIGAVEAK